VLSLAANTETGTRIRTSHGVRFPSLGSRLAVFPLWAVLVACAAQAQVSPSQSSPAPFAGAIIREWKGDVHVQLPGTSLVHPQRGQVLPAGTMVETGNGRLLLVLRTDESEILIQPHTRLVVKEPASGMWNTLDITLGRIRAYIRKRTGGTPPFQMGTPSAVIAVRGTRFDVEVNARGVSEIDVFDGMVEVAAPGIPGASVVVSPGFSTRVGIGKPPETPVPTREIRPDVDVPGAIAQQEFIRENAGQEDRASKRELGERPDSEPGEAVGESPKAEPEKD
jgi:hypothetical protein